jgi:hypothetical protein
MKTENYDCKCKSCVLVEGPAWGDAEFYGKWLLSAAKANELLQQAKRDDPEFSRSMDILEPIHLLDIGIAATRFVSQFYADKQFCTYVIKTDREHPETDPGEHVDFVPMAEMGFFKLTGNRYQMTLPPDLDLDTVKQAYLKLAATEDEDWIHPERLVVDMPYSWATNYQRSLRKMNQGQRLADRRALLFLD